MTGLDRDAARDVLRAYLAMNPSTYPQEDALDALEKCVRLEPAQGIDRAALVTLFLDRLRGTTVLAFPLADDVLALLRPAPEQTIDREELLDLLDNMSTTSTEWREKVADRVLALLRPADGVTLTHDEARLAAEALNNVAGQWDMNGNNAQAMRRYDLAERLEAVS